MLQVLAYGNRNKFKTNISNHMDSIIDMYDDGIYLNNDITYTHGYIAGIKYVINMIAEYESKEIRRFTKCTTDIIQ